MTARRKYTGPEVWDNERWGDPDTVNISGPTRMRKADIPGLIAQLLEHVPRTPGIDGDDDGPDYFVEDGKLRQKLVYGSRAVEPQPPKPKAGPQPFAAERALAERVLREAEAETKRGYKPKRETRAERNARLEVASARFAEMLAMIPEGKIELSKDFAENVGKEAARLTPPKRKAKAKRGAKR